MPLYPEYGGSGEIPSAPQQPVAQELVVVRRAPLPDAQLALAADTRRLVARYLRDSQTAPRRTDGEERLPADPAAEEKLRRAIPAVLVQFEVVDDLLAVGAVNHHRIGVTAAVKQVDGPREQPVAKRRQPVVVFAPCR